MSIGGGTTRHYIISEMAPFWPFRRPEVERDPLAVTMIGVRMGERVLQIADEHSPLVAAVAAKPGMSGTSAIIAVGAAAAERLRAAVSESGALVDLHVGPMSAMPFPDAAFDAVVMHHASRILASLDEVTHSQAIRECRRVLRLGGRMVVVDGSPRSGFGGLLGGKSSPVAPEDAGGTAKLLQQAGFAAVRVLAEREGYRFIEGLNA